ncbi:MAG: AAA family ATPase, partial [Pseudomonadota bacterium]|nr:AAA family ATPase [Pseudomonadota bacterium]
MNSTALLSRVDPEDFSVAQQQIHAAASRVFERYGGYLDRIVGDGGCAYFGYPRPSEDAAECAITAALEFLEQCRSLNPVHEVGESLRVRVGIATGVVLLNTVGGIGPANDVQIVGLAPSLAARVQAEAEPDSVAVADATYRLTRVAFDFEPLGPRHLKGFDEPQHLWRPLKRKSAGDRFSVLQRSETPLVARADELDMCRRRWTRACEGEGQVVFLVGEAGIGKSRLVAELRREISGAGHPVRLFQNQPRGNVRPLHPFLDALRREICGSTDQSVEPDPSAVHTYLALTAPGSSKDTARMMSFLIQEGADPEAFDPDLARLPGDELRQRAVDAVLDVLTAWCRTAPQVIVLEDLHWADTLTNAFLSRLVDEAQHLPILLIVTSRDPISADLTGDPHVLSISLSRLSASAASRLIAAIWQPLPQPHGLAGFIHDRSDGVPLFLEELGYLLKERIGASRTDPGHWESVLRQGGIATLQDLLAARLASVGEARRVAQIASVIGREFSYDLLAGIVEGDDVAALLDEHLATLVKAGLLRRRGIEDRLVFRFRHVLLQEAAYAGLLKSERREYHDRIVRLAADGRVTELPNEIMFWHSEQAGRLLQAADYAIKAAESCAIRSAVQEAHRLLRAADDCLKRCSSDPAAEDLALQLLATWGPVEVALFGKGSPEARTIYERGVALCHERALEDREKWFPLYWGWWFTSLDRNMKRARSQTIISQFERSNDPEISLQALHCAWAANFHAGSHFECLHCIEEGLALYDPERAIVSRAKYGGHDAKVCALAERGLSLWLTGDEKAAVESMEAAVRWAEEIDHLGSLCHALDVAMMLCCYRDDFREAAALA